MEILLRELGRTKSDSLDYQDREYSGKVITIGSSPSQIVQLAGDDVAPVHATLKPSGSGFRLRCSRGHRVKIGEAAVKSAKLGLGDTVEIGGHRLEVIAPPAGFDFALQITPDFEALSSSFEKAFVTQVSQAVVSKRQLSWTLSVLVFLVGFAIPLYQVIQRQEPGASTVELAIDDRLWSSGPLIPAHDLAIGNDCGVCHVSLFERVADEQCQTCHTAISDHIHSASPAVADFSTARCATCHREHNPPELIVQREDRLCVGCHEDSIDHAPAASLRAVTGFTLETHPSFDATLLTPTVTEVGGLLSFEWIARSAALEDAVEMSNLTFPHDVHLDETRVLKLTDDSPLVCGDCHELSADREHFEPVTMETNCRDCHDLRFDLSEPTRELPHGEPSEVIFALEGHFMRKLGNPDANNDLPDRRPLPDRGGDEEICAEAAYDCAVSRTLVEAANQFTVRGCITCHVVERNDELSIYDRFQVHPVRLTADYFPAARFDHASHQMQGELTGDAACMSCHTAETSTASSDLLIPDIGTCTACHGDVSVANRVPLNCIGCHTYHPEQRLSAEARFPE